MKRKFTFLASLLFIGNAFAQDDICIKYKSGVEQCFPIDEIDKIYMKPDAFIPSGQYLNHYYVDLGLPSGLLWATYDVGASGIKQMGSLYGWAEVETSETYNWEDLKYYERDNDSYRFLKYVTSDFYIPNPDYLTTLQPEDDAATSNWGEGWRIPTKEEWNELIEGCTWECVTTPSVMMSYCDDCEEIVSFGLVGTSKYNGLKIYFPKNISKFGNSFTITTKYWTSSVYEDNHFEAWLLSTEYGESSAEFNSYHDSRYLGCSIRPVTSKK